MSQNIISQNNILCELRIGNAALTLYALTGRIRPVLPKFQF